MGTYDFVDNNDNMDISDEDSKRNLDEALKRFGLDDNKNVSQENEKFAAGFANPSYNNNLNASQNQRWDAKLKYQNPNLLQKVKSIIRRGPKRGETKYEKRQFQKFKYSNGRATALTPTFSKLLEQKGYTREVLKKMSSSERRKLYASIEVNFDPSKNKYIARQRQNPQSLKSFFTKGYKRLTNVKSNEKFLAARQASYQKQYENYLSNNSSPPLSPAYAAAKMTNSNLSKYNQQLQQSYYEYIQNKQEARNRILLIDQQRRQVLENQKQANQLASENMFSPSNPFMNSPNAPFIDINASVFADPLQQNNIMVQRPDSIDILTGAKKQGRPTLLQTNPSYDILNAPNLFLSSGNQIVQKGGQ